MSPGRPSHSEGAPRHGHTSHHDDGEGFGQLIGYLVEVP